MIDIRELRYGNTVEYNGKHYHVCSICDKIKIGTMISPVMYAGAFNVDINEINPIPLAEDILLKCGFEKEVIPLITEVHNIFQNDYMTLSQEYGSFHWYSNGNYYDNFDVKILSLHELQNLFYGLTKTELNIQL